MEKLYVVLGIGFLILNIVLLVYFFQACKDIQSIKKGVGLPSEKDFYNQFLKLISQDKPKEAAKILHEHFWNYCSFYQTSLKRTEDLKDQKKWFEEYTEPYKNLFELIGEKMPELLPTSIVKQVESIKENQGRYEYARKTYK